MEAPSKPQGIGGNGGKIENKLYLSETFVFQPSYDKIQAGREFSRNRPSSIPVVAGADYDKLAATNDFAAVYDNPMASPSAKEVMLIDFNDNAAEYTKINQKPEAAYEEPLQRRPQKEPSPYDNPKELMKTREYQQASNIGR